MNLLVILGVVALLAVLAWRKVSMLAWLGGIWVAALIFFRFGFTTPVPVSVIKIYMGIVTLALFAYIFADTRRWAEVRDPLVAFMTEKRFLLPLGLVLLLIPTLAAAKIYLDLTKTPQAPNFARTIHPAPPDAITVHDKEFDLVALENPLRDLETSDPEAFAEHVAKGRATYYANCFYCHGDLMKGEGMFANGLNPIPTSFQDPGTIAMLKESFLFWRIAKGAPGLPSEGGPWDSAMPAWESFLSEEEIWETILFLYDFTGHRPRATEAH